MVRILMALMGSLESLSTSLPCFLHILHLRLVQFFIRGFLDMNVRRCSHLGIVFEECEH